MIVADASKSSAGLDALDVAASQRVMWRPAAGATWYLNGHRVKLQLMRRESVNPPGLARMRATFAQAHVAF